MMVGTPACEAGSAYCASVLLPVTRHNNDGVIEQSTSLVVYPAVLREQGTAYGYRRQGSAKLSCMTTDCINPFGK